VNVRMWVKCDFPTWDVTQTSRGVPVTDHKLHDARRIDVPTLTVAGVPVHERIAAAAPYLLRVIVARLVEEVPFYRLLPREQIRGEVTDVVARSLRLLVTVIREGRDATDEELARQRDSAARRAEEGVPLDAVLSAYHLGVTISWGEISDGAEPTDLPGVQAALALVMRLHQQVTAAVSAAYVEERHIIDSQAHSGRRALLTALATGAPSGTVTAAAQEAGVQVAPAYVAMTLVVAPHPEDGPDAGAKVAARRRRRRLQAALDRFSGEPAPSALEPAGGTALLPLRGDVSWPELHALVAQTGRELGTEVTAACCAAPPSDVPDALRRSAEIADLVAGSHRPPGLYRLDDVLLEYQLSRPSAAHPALAARLDPLAGKADLLLTLEEYLRSGLSRRRTAALLHVHPNTVDYRIRRVAHLTGLTPADPADLQLLNAALVARRVLGRASAARPRL
jgi:PucR-like helix-turn-helix protein